MSMSIIFHEGRSWFVQGKPFHELIERAGTHLSKDEAHIFDLLAFAETIGWLNLPRYNVEVRRKLLYSLHAATEEWICEFRRLQPAARSVSEHFEALLAMTRESLNEIAENRNPTSE
jgi:hypothetical protein